MPAQSRRLTRALRRPYIQAKPSSRECGAMIKWFLSSAVSLSGR
jgi:hypothetical protein